VSQPTAKGYNSQSTAAKQDSKTDFLLQIQFQAPDECEGHKRKHKVNESECTYHRVSVAPHQYTKGNGKRTRAVDGEVALHGRIPTLCSRLQLWHPQRPWILALRKRESNHDDGVQYGPDGNSVQKPFAPIGNTVEESHNQERDGNLSHAETEDAKRLRDPVHLDQVAQVYRVLGSEIGQVPGSAMEDLLTCQDSERHKWDLEYVSTARVRYSNCEICTQVTSMHQSSVASPLMR
jgi:hypothetical protein